MKIEEQGAAHPQSRCEGYRSIGTDLICEPADVVGEAVTCPRCGAVYRRDNWQWLTQPARSSAAVCPDCASAAEQRAVGYVYLGGNYVANHRDELLRLIRRCEADAMRKQPMERILAIGAEAEQTVVSTATVHLARDLGLALKSAFHGTLVLRFNKPDNILRVFWHR